MKFSELEPLAGMLDRHKLGPTCRRCGKPVESVDTYHETQDPVAVFVYQCHGAVHRHKVRIDGLMRFRADRDWLSTFPTHVFEYEAVSFGKWDANGAPVEEA